MSGLHSHEGELEKALARLGGHVPFADLMAERHIGESTSLDSKATSVSAEPRMQGAILRAWEGRYWVEAATSDFDPRSLSDAVERLVQAASRSPTHNPPPGQAATTRGEWSTKPRRPMSALGPEGMVARARTALGWAKSVEGIGEAQIRIQWEEEERLYLNTAGARCSQTTNRTHFTAVPVAIEGGRAEFDFLNSGGIGGEEILDALTEANLTATARRSKELLSAKAPPAGSMSVILDPSVAGLFAHESFGHGTEADQFLRDRSYLKPLLGAQVGPDFLSIADDGALPGEWGSIYCDDEGHPGQKTTLVEKGRFVGALHDSETAAAYRVKPTGNTRRSDFLSRAFVRMTNTYVEPGDRTLEELVAEVKQGVLLERGTSGIEDPLGGQMQLKVKMGHRIENGQIKELVSSMALSGRVLDFMRAIRAVGRRADFSIQPGYCGKGHSDYLPVGSGGVYLLSDAVVGPA
ncbi:MAG: TldD/PmbA family protein [Thermoplasmata archaeon]